MPHTITTYADRVTTSAGTFAPIHIYNHVLISATRFSTITPGTIVITINPTSGSNTTVYLHNSITLAYETRVLTPMSSTSFSLNASVVYTILLVQTNVAEKESIFVETIYTGQLLPKLGQPFTEKDQTYYCGDKPCGVLCGTSTCNESGCGGERGSILPRASVAAVGDLKLSARTHDFDGWLLCDGRAVSRTVFRCLFAVIGVKFRSGDGTTTFNIPDFRGRVPGGIGTGPGLSTRELGEYVGEEATGTRDIVVIPSVSGITVNVNVVNDNDDMQPTVFIGSMFICCEI